FAVAPGVWFPIRRRLFEGSAVARHVLRCDSSRQPLEAGISPAFSEAPLVVRPPRGVANDASHIVCRGEVVLVANSVSRQDPCDARERTLAHRVRQSRAVDDDDPTILGLLTAIDQALDVLKRVSGKARD